MQARFNSEFWQISLVAVGATRSFQFEQPIWIETRILGRKDHYAKTHLDYRVSGLETALWRNAVIELETTVQANQFPGSIVTSQAAQPTLGAERWLIRHLSSGREAYIQSGSELRTFVKACFPAQASDSQAADLDATEG